jgi:hypothetical protein
VPVVVLLELLELPPVPLLLVLVGPRMQALERERSAAPIQRRFRIGESYPTGARGAQGSAILERRSPSFEDRRGAGQRMSNLLSLPLATGLKVIVLPSEYASATGIS